MNRLDIIIVAFEYFQLGGHFCVDLLLKAIVNIVSVVDAKNFVHFSVIVSVAVAH